MAYDFPNSPTIGQRVTMPDSTVRSWDGTKWRASSATGSYTPPSSPRLTTNLTPVTYPSTGTAETDLQTYSLPAGSLATDGQCVHIRAVGTCGNLASIRTVRLYFGATQIGIIQPGTGGPFNWDIEAWVWRNGASAQIASGRANTTSNNNAGTPNTSLTTPAETLANPITIKTTGGLSVQGANAITSSVLMVELL